MKFVALLSGGKDSCFNIMHCFLNGHELVAAASLRPPSGKGARLRTNVYAKVILTFLEEIDSYMYQTVGQDAIQYVADALEVPLFRRTIDGNPLDQRLVYGSRDRGGFQSGTEGDETEDMFKLLSDVKVRA